MWELLKIKIVVPWSIGFSCKQFEGRMISFGKKASECCGIPHPNPPEQFWHTGFTGIGNYEAARISCLTHCLKPVHPSCLQRWFVRYLAEMEIQWNTILNQYYWCNTVKQSLGHLHPFTRIEMRNQTYGTCCSSWDPGESDLSSWQRTPGSSTARLRHRQIFEKLKEHCHDKNIVIVVFFI